MKTTYTRAPGRRTGPMCTVPGLPPSKVRSRHLEEMIIMSFVAVLPRGGTLSRRGHNILQIRSERLALSCRGSKGLARSFAISALPLARWPALPCRSIRIERRREAGGAARFGRARALPFVRPFVVLPCFKTTWKKSSSPPPPSLPPFPLHSSPHNPTGELPA